MIDGIINIHKEAGFTSHDVVAKMRGILKQKKIGHTGTLDPEATGVLPVCVGKGTKLCEMLTDKEKTYEAVLLLGVETDTQDMTGEILQSKDVKVSPQQVEEVIQSFVGEQLQIPPMYSALKVNGKKLYELAREGKVVERKARNVTFYKIEILEVDLPRVKMEVTCSKGTYIRTLCHDIGQKLQCGGAMEQLIRTKVGRFSLTDSITLGELQLFADEGRVEQVLCSIEDMFAECPAFTCSSDLDKLLHNGNPLDVKAVTDQLVKGWIKAYDSSGKFIGIYETNSAGTCYYPVKMFY